MTCPSCGSPRVFPSRFRGRFEQLRCRFTDRQPYRCHACNWRAWRPIEMGTPHPDTTPDDLRSPRPSPPVSGSDLDPLDPTPR